MNKETVFLRWKVNPQQEGDRVLCGEQGLGSGFAPPAVRWVLTVPRSPPSSM